MGQLYGELASDLKLREYSPPTQEASKSPARTSCTRSRWSVTPRSRARPTLRRRIAKGPQPSS